MDPASGLNGAMEMATEAPSARETPSSMPSQPEPGVPQKPDHAQELARLKKELAEVEDARDIMEVEFLKLQEDVEEKDEQLSKLSKEIWTWKDIAESRANSAAQERSSKDVNDTSEIELAQARQEIQRLTAALAESEAAIDQHATAASSPRSNSPVADSPVGEGELRLLFESRLAEAQEELRNQVNEEHKLRVAAEGSLQSAREYYENKMKEVEQQAQTSIAEQQQSFQEAFSASQPVSIDSVDAGEIEALRGRVNDLETRIREQHRCTEQYRRMSERLTTQVKQANMEKRTVEQSEQMLRRQLEDSRLQRHTSQRHQQMPGSYR
jgi:hypothetical protein